MFLMLECMVYIWPHFSSSGVDQKVVPTDSEDLIPWRFAYLFNLKYLRGHISAAKISVTFQG